MEQGVNGRRAQHSLFQNRRTVNAGDRSGRISPVRGALAVHALVLLYLLFMPYGAGAEEGRGYLDISGGYKTGDFGTPTRSNLYYLAPALGYITPRYDVSVTVPYLSLTTETGGTSTTESGIGDIILRGGMVLLPEGKGGFSLDATLAVKLPTADETKGLGTGETDYGACFGLHQRLGTFKLSFLGGYLKVGDSPSINYNDIYLYGIGLSRVFGHTDLYTSLEGRRSVIPGAKNPQEINVGFFHVLSTEYALKGSAFFGLNDGGPDFGTSIGIVRWF